MPPLRLLHVINLVFIPPMIILGILLLLAGENPTPRYTQLGIILIVISAPMAIGCVNAANSFWRSEKRGLAYAIDVVPMITWTALVILVATQTEFFYQTCC